MPMHYEVVGWTAMLDDEYPDFIPKSDLDYNAARLAVIREIRKNSYSFSGDMHENRDFGVPVLNSGKKFCASMRGWGSLMAEAWNIPKTEMGAYMMWFMDYTFFDCDRPPEGIEQKFPEPGVDRSRIHRYAKIDYSDVPEDYEPCFYIIDTLAALKMTKKFVELSGMKTMTMMTLDGVILEKIVDGAKSVVIFPDTEDNRSIKTGDIIDFKQKDDLSVSVRTEVVEVCKFSTLIELFSSDLSEKTGYGYFAGTEAEGREYDFYDTLKNAQDGVLAVVLKK